MWEFATRYVHFRCSILLLATIFNPLVLIDLSQDNPAIPSTTLFSICNPPRCLAIPELNFKFAHGLFVLEPETIVE